MRKKVGIVLVNYKDYVNRFLAECRDSLRQQTYPEELTRVYIVDNASSKKSREYIKNNYKEAIVLPREDGNYAAANNIGITRAREDGCEYFVIANMDTKFEKNWLRELVDAAENDPSIGLVQSKILLYPKTKEERLRPKLNSTGNIMHYLGFGFTGGYREVDKKIDGLPEIKGYASGCSFITKKKVIEKIGGYDEEYYMYHDDIEMSWRVKLAGYKIVLAPKSVLYHKFEFSRSMRMVYYMERNRYLAMFHYYHWLSILLILPAIVIMEVGMILYSIMGGWFKIKLKVIGYFLLPSTWKKIYIKRRLVKKIRKRTDKAIVNYFEGRVIYQEIDNPLLKYFGNPLLNVYWRAIKKIIIW